jgi:hypothetical protein
MICGCAIVGLWEKRQEGE